MTLHIDDTAPDFTIESTKGKFSLHEWMGSSWCFLFSHPADFTPICTTEISQKAKLDKNFVARNFDEILRVIHSLVLERH